MGNHGAFSDITRPTGCVEGDPDGLLEEVGAVDGEGLDLRLPRPRRGHVELARRHVGDEDLRPHGPVVAVRHEAHLALPGAPARRPGEQLDRVDDGLVDVVVDAVEVDLVVLGLRRQEAPLLLVVGQAAEPVRLLLEHDGVDAAVVLLEDVEGPLVHDGHLLLGQAEHVPRRQKLRRRRKC